MVLMRRDPAGRIAPVTPDDFYVRTRVHEYGGGAWCLHGDDGRSSSTSPTSVSTGTARAEPRPLTPERRRRRGAALRRRRGSPGRHAPSICVREVHRGDAVDNELVSLPLDGSGEATVLASGHDFYSFPRLSPDGRWLAWICWDHPNMPWDGTELWVAPLADPAAARLVAGGPAESIFQPEWSPDGRAPLRLRPRRLVEPAAAARRRLSRGAHAPSGRSSAHPQWVFGGATYAFLDGGAIACVRCDGGRGTARPPAPRREPLEELGLPYTAFGLPAPQRQRGPRRSSLAASPERETVVAGLRAAERRDARSCAARRDRGRPGLRLESRGRSSSRPAAATPRTPSSTRRANPDFEAPGGRAAAADRAEPRRPDRRTRPRRSISRSSSGPAAASASSTSTTAAAPATAAPTARLLNGRLGHRRRRRLRRRGAATWPRAARPTASGWRSTAAAPAATRPSARSSSTTSFAAGASYYGVADAETLARDTHKFESRYLDGLIGPYPEQAELYRERSPIHYVDRLRAPVILFQGLEDEVVPPSQAETMVAALHAQRRAPRLPRLRGRAARLPPRRDR